MAYSAFKNRDVREKLGLEILKESIFDLQTIVPLKPSEWLRQTHQLATHFSLASEKARSELLVNPILMEMVQRNNFSFSLFSGVSLEVDNTQGLNGECDFIFAARPNLIDVVSPIFALIEAKDNDIKLGIPQCAAQMYAARLLNLQDGEKYQTIWGCVTTGTDWQFLRLHDQQLSVHPSLFYVNEVEVILGILQMIIEFE